MSHAAVLDASSTTVTGAGTGAESQTLYGVRNGTLATDSGNFENTGDDFVLSEWFWFNFANLTIESGFMTFTTLAQVTGQGISYSNSAGSGIAYTGSPTPSTGFTAGSDYYGLPLWVWSSLNQITRPVALRVPARDSQGAVRTQDFILYRVQFMPFNFTGPSYKNGLTVSLAGRALMSLYDEQGNVLPASYPRSLGRIVNSPGTQTGAFTAQPFAGI